MARPLRIEFAGALYHVTSRGDRREAIYEDDADREAFLDWRWSSYRAAMGLSPAPPWLAVDALLSRFASDRQVARERYRRFALEGVGSRVWEHLRQQIYLGDDAFVERRSIDPSPKVMC